MRSEPADRGAPGSTRPDARRSLCSSGLGFLDSEVNRAGVVWCGPFLQRRRIRADFGVAAAAGLRRTAFQGREGLGLQNGFVGQRRASPLGCSVITPFYISVRKVVCAISPRNTEGRGRGVLRGGSPRQATSETRG